MFSRRHTPTNSVAPLSAYKPTHNPKFLQSLWRRANARNVSFFTLFGGQFSFSTQSLTLNYHIKNRSTPFVAWEIFINLFVLLIASTSDFFQRFTNFALQLFARRLFPSYFAHTDGNLTCVGNRALIFCLVLFSRWNSIHFSPNFEELSCGDCYVIDQSRRQKVTSLCLSGWNYVQRQAKKEKRACIQKKPSPLTHKKSWPLTLNQLKAQ